MPRQDRKPWFVDLESATLGRLLRPPNHRSRCPVGRALVARSRSATVVVAPRRVRTLGRAATVEVVAVAEVDAVEDRVKAARPRAG